MPDRPYVVLSCAMSVDGYIDDATGQRLLLSNDEDFDRVDAERAASDAILVGASTIRKDDPRLLVRSQARQADRVRDGRAPSPAKVTLTSSGDLDPAARFFTAGSPEVQRLVYCPSGGAADLAARLAGQPGIEVVATGERAELAGVLADLARRGVRRVLAEGGTTIHTQLLAGGLADELQLVVAPFFIGASAAPRFVADGSFPCDAAHRMTLAEVRQIGDVVLLRYLVRDGATAAGTA